MTELIQKDRVESAEAPAELKVTDRWLEIFALFVHDLESPLVSTKYLLSQMETGRFDLENKTHQRLLQSSRIALDRAESILYDIMAVARAGNAGLPVAMANLVPTALIKEAVTMSSGSAIELGVDVSFTNNAGDIPIQADPKLLKRMLDNLIFNALRHTPNGGQVAVYTEPGDECVFIHVKDSGSGLGDIDHVQLFEKYGQVKMRAQGKHRGVGLGLYFCRLAATGMGGTILADDHPKGGAVFSIKLKKAEGK
ncbi:MAG: HAMP domain-containing histidine kinase [candidate division Zixibacteria bacterium]|nr:HAMP domain-containing histidine kinase [candidate division Zixibacteria bacterium]